jgi:predicted helicase
MSLQLIQEYHHKVQEILQYGGSRNETAIRTDWALKQFQSHYQDKSITRLDIFHYVYAVIHDPTYRRSPGSTSNGNSPASPFTTTFVNGRPGAGGCWSCTSGTNRPILSP